MQKDASLVERRHALTCLSRANDQGLEKDKHLGQSSAIVQRRDEAGPSASPSPEEAGRKSVEAAIKIQSHARRRKAACLAKKYQEERRAAARVQSFARQKMARREVRESRIGDRGYFAHHHSLERVGAFPLGYNLPHSRRRVRHRQQLGDLST